MCLLSAEKIKKTYTLKRIEVPVLTGLDLKVNRGEWVAILGKSGSGKSTLLHLLGGLDRVDKKEGGKIIYKGMLISGKKPAGLNRFRNREVGFVFQFYHLLPELTVLENTLITAMIGRRVKSETRKRAEDLLKAFGLQERLNHKPAELSGGERERVAMARALINNPDLILADEPTGNLDPQTGASIMDALSRLHQEEGQTIVMVTHDHELAKRADRCLYLEKGRLRDY